MSHLQSLVDVLNAHQSLPPHHDPKLKHILIEIQHWQKSRIRHTNEMVFKNNSTPCTWFDDHIDHDKDCDIFDLKQAITP